MSSGGGPCGGTGPRLGSRGEMAGGGPRGETEGGATCAGEGRLGGGRCGEVAGGAPGVPGGGGSGVGPGGGFGRESATAAGSFLKMKTCALVPNLSSAPGLRMVRSEWAMRTVLTKVPVGDSRSMMKQVPVFLSQRAAACWPATEGWPTNTWEAAMSRPNTRKSCGGTKEIQPISLRSRKVTSWKP